MALKQANSFWVRGEGQEWFSAQIVSVVDSIFTLRYDDGHIEQVSSKSSQILPRNPENVEDSDDLVVLPNLDEPNVLQSLFLRYSFVSCL
jgi:myosin heavy subunit